MCIFQEALSSFHSAFMLSKHLSFHSALFHFIALLFFLHSAFILLHSALSKYPKCESALYYFSKCESACYLIFFSKTLFSYCFNFLIWSASFFDHVWLFLIFFIYLFPIYVIYSNTLVHSSPHLPVYCMGRWVRLHCLFTNGNIKYDTTFYA